MTKAMNSEALTFCSGIGQYHSENNSVDPRPYLDISLPDIEAMVLNPQRVPKPEARWAIPSTEKTRIHSAQQENGQFGFVWADLDYVQCNIDVVAKTLRAILPPGTKFFVYTSKSATPENQRCRVIIEYANLLGWQDHELAAQILNDRLEAAGIKPDHKSELSGQLCYLPNAGEFYDYHIEHGEPLDPIRAFGDEMAAKRTLRIEEEQRRQQSREESQRKYEQRRASGFESPIEAFNLANQVEDVLELFGYKKIRGRYLSPNSSSGSPGVSVKDGRWVSSHESDAATVGKFGDAFDLFVYYQHHGNRTAALKEAREKYCQSSSSSAGVEFGPEFFEGKQQAPPKDEGLNSLNSLNSQGANENESDIAILKWPKLDEKALHGFAGRFVRFATENSEADPAAVLITLLVRFGIELPAPTMWVGDALHRANLCSVIVGASSKARKGTSAKPIARLFEPMAFPDGTLSLERARTTPGPFSSGEGIIYAVRDVVMGADKKTGEPIPIDPGVDDKRLFVLDEEFGGVLAQTKREGNTLSAIIRMIWDGGNLDPLTKTSKIKATGAHIGWVSHITVPELAARLSETEGLNGFGNRILWCCARRSKLVAWPAPMDAERLQQFQYELSEIIASHHDTKNTLPNEEVEYLWEAQYYPELTREKPGLAGCLINRAEAQVMRLAMVYALLDRSSIITPVHLEAAHALWTYCEQSALYIFGGREADGTAQRIIDALQDGPLTGAELHKAFANHLSKAQLTRALQELEASGKIGVTQETTGGRPRTTYFLNKTGE